MSKRKAPVVDDVTLAGIAIEAENTAKRRVKAKPVEHTDPWDAVAAECPCRVSAEGHKANPERVHITTYKGPVMCVPGVAVEANRYLPQPMPVGWRTTDAYRLAELVGRKEAS